MSDNNEKIRVSLNAPKTPAGLMALAMLWEKDFPRASCDSMSAYGRLELTLLMPEGTQVVPPALPAPETE